jgi:5,5'-dehydrodivanillate O-demethylase
MNQDFVAWVGQGAVTDRAREHLGQSDRGIVMMRRRLQQQLDALSGGSNELKAVIRDPAENECVKLPIVDRDILREGLPRDAFSAAQAKAPRGGEFPFLIGQPPDIRAAWRHAMGLPAE